MSDNAIRKWLGLKKQMHGCPSGRRKRIAKMDKNIKISDVDLNLLKEIVEREISFTNILKSLNLNIGNGGHYRTLINRLKKENISYEHLYNKEKYMSYGRKRNLNDILVENSTYSTKNLKRKLLKEGILENKCSICGKLPIWRDKPLVMILDHINGVNNDHRLENLRLVCPDCNSQLPTFAGRNTKYKRNYCKKCGKQLRNYNKTQMCSVCLNNEKTRLKFLNLNKKCINCNNETKGKSKTGLCVSCSQRKRHGNLNKPSIEQLK